MLEVMHQLLTSTKYSERKPLEMKAVMAKAALTREKKTIHFLFDGSIAAILLAFVFFGYSAGAVPI